ncbi:conserved hypothetical protein [Methylorubrum populi BJ001]|jgi:hypothetical protein|uniref:Uncharacterized protein n=1 Tax=Methylorubrum populi (strain ATCC BAA-705 / NCIMB 13946 / BJ001) TaxID=441620 RepID=B1ZI85_METPB|nr:hypothetical protein [Methylorubrum populi]ACB78571.1 conserved hypothetical protein [Methylorubrum populi BJ001]PZP69870.1 MAG: hypothetical protein DI590_12270 [Methylorubrum populi]
MDPHSFEQDGVVYEVRFERTPDGWIARIRPEDGAEAHVFAFPDGIGFDPEDVRGSLIAGCEAAVARIPRQAPTRH